MFVIGRQRIKTFMEFENNSRSINCITGIESQDQRHLRVEELFTEILCNNVKNLRVNNTEESPELS